MAEMSSQGGKYNTVRYPYVSDPKSLSSNWYELWLFDAYSEFRRCCDVLYVGAQWARGGGTHVRPQPIQFWCSIFWGGDIKIWSI